MNLDKQMAILIIVVLGLFSVLIVGEWSNFILNLTYKHLPEYWFFQLLYMIMTTFLIMLPPILIVLGLLWLFRKFTK